ncbi:MAG: hypothetical protein GX786_04805 [Clostridiales bacterium]|nr:hypothetical protein [Clostridiales bacterium]
MAEKNNGQKWKIILLTVLSVVLIVLILSVTGQTKRVYKDLKFEQNATASPSPDTRSMLAVTPDPSAPTPSPAPLLLKNGSSGDQVVHLQNRLHQLGFYFGEIDGQFGEGTKEAVMWFQQQHHLAVDGLVGSDTMDRIDSDNAEHAIATPAPSPSPTSVPLQNVDISGQGGLPLLINKDYPIGSDFQAENLVLLKDVCPEELVTIKYAKTQGNALAAEALNAMFQAAHEEELTSWQVSAGYRSYGDQQSLLDSKVSEYVKKGFSKDRALSAASQTVALPGTSEHHSGLAFDITVPNEPAFKYTPQSAWLEQNCWDYGFIIRYQEGKESITGFAPEPWHIRYVGTQHSIPIRDQSFTLEEYLAQKSSELTFE